MQKRSYDEARDLSEIIDTFRKTHELADIERRVAALEKETAHASAVKGPIPDGAPVIFIRRSFTSAR